jgi:predicted GNAT family acetyltransferase
MTADDWRVTRFDKAAEFLEAALDFLARQEAHNCVPLGLAAQLRDNPERQILPPYMAVVNSGGEIVAAAAMTPPHGLVLAMTEVSGAMAALAADAYDFWPQLPGAIAPVQVAQWFAEAWRAQTGDEVHQAMSERLYQLTRVRPQRPVPGQARRASEADRALLREWLTDFDIEAFGRAPSDVDWRIDTMLTVSQRGIYLWEVEGQPVSLAGYVGPTPRGIRIGPVYTPPALRGRGYASACVARLSQDKLDEGRTFCFLYTDLMNPTSNHIYQEIGYEPVCDVADYRFTRPAVAH